MKTALIIIDVQKAIDDPQWGERNNFDAEINMSELLEYWRIKERPIIHIKHSSINASSPYRKGQPSHNFKPEVTPLNTEIIIEKSTNNAFVNTKLDDYLKDNDISSLVVIGVLTQHSVDCTARMAASLGYEVTVVSNAVFATNVTDRTGKKWTASEVHELTLANLEADYANIKTTKELLTELHL